MASDAPVSFPESEGGFSLDIYGTLGPACHDTDTLEAMFRAGMTGIRLNLSHVTLAQSCGALSCLHDAAKRCGRQAKLLIDMQGPELRLGALSAPMPLTTGQIVHLGSAEIPVPEIVLPHLLPGQQILLDDGKLLLEIVPSTHGNICAVCLRGGLLKSRKSIALPGVSLFPPAMTQEDLENITLASQFGVTGVMQPFVRNHEDLKTVRTALDTAGSNHIRLFAKIENQDGVTQLHSLMPFCDEIVIARGDLGNAVPLWQLPALQKQIAAACNQVGKPFMVVTQMLASMEQNPVPTRAEVSDIFNAVLDGATSVMVTGETAAGRYPVETIAYLSKTARAALDYRHVCSGQ